jgi:hypothetical protein
MSSNVFSTAKSQPLKHHKNKYHPVAAFNGQRAISEGISEMPNSSYKLHSFIVVGIFLIQTKHNALPEVHAPSSPLF